VVPDSAAGERLDRWLAGRLGEQSRSAVQRLVRTGKVRVDGRTAAKPGITLGVGATVEVDLPQPCPDALIPESIPLDVVYEDRELLVLDKPAGTVVHPGHGCREGTVVHALLGRGTPLASLGAPDRPGIVHRLDRGTSGLLVVAKTNEAHAALAAAFARREVRKRYTALVWGHPRPETGSIERRIARSRADRTRMAVATGGREASTSYRTLESLPGFALLSLAPRTGRTHQIRVHLQSIHHPVVGDERYGGRPWRGLTRVDCRNAVRDFRRLALHAAELGFRHPASGRELTFEAPLPADFEKLLAVLRQEPR
jgi:23S rRNA pseudouridine1911/1915/1917 synthase